MIETPITRGTLLEPAPAPASVDVFTREAHTSYLLGQVLDLKLQETKPLENPHNNDQLNSTLQALSAVLANDVNSENGAYYCAAVGMCNSALLALHTPSFSRPHCRKALNSLSSEQKLRRLISWKVSLFPVKYDFFIEEEEGLSRLKDLSYISFTHETLTPPPPIFLNKIKC